MISAEKDIKNKTEILALLKTLFLPKRLSIIHCPGHQKGNSPIAKGNRMADEAASAAALGQEIMCIDSTRNAPPKEPLFLYTDQDLDEVQKLNANFDGQLRVWKHWGKIILPLKDAHELVAHLHRWTHLGHKKLKTLRQKEEQFYFIPKLNSFIQWSLSLMSPAPR